MTKIKKRVTTLLKWAGYTALLLAGIQVTTWATLHGARQTLHEQRRELLAAKVDSARRYCLREKINTDFCILVDMKMHSGKKRFFVWDLSADTLILSSLVAHGSGGESTASTPAFSNVPGSHCTSLGKYRVGARAPSRWGIRVHYKLHGQESTNNNAYKRIVVLHSFDYIPARETYPLHLPLGMSLGCPVINNTAMTRLDALLSQQKKPTLLWIYD
ncbi:MAG: murein L,D-transpeptidase catalytic domain family protein [Odoribacteraceae bacterium]|jgi:hypothetical protein|nr:murein L,D-transpeptidase catalytic domain family protein [Odoribacteraceae bacterium]